MADITMCRDSNCPLKDTCYRFKANPSFMQSYFLDSPRTEKDCEYYWEDKEKKEETDE